MADESGRDAGVRLADVRGHGPVVAEQHFHFAGPIGSDGSHVEQLVGHAGGRHVEQPLQVGGQPRALDGRTRRAVRMFAAGHGRPRAQAHGDTSRSSVVNRGRGNCCCCCRSARLGDTIEFGKNDVVRIIGAGCK